MCLNSLAPLFSFFFFNLFLIICFSVPGLSWDMQGLVPWPGLEPGPPALGAQSLRHWSIREVPPLFSIAVHSVLTFWIVSLFSPTSVVLEGIWRHFSYKPSSINAWFLVHCFLVFYCLFLSHTCPHIHEWVHCETIIIALKEVFKIYL